MAKKSATEPLPIHMLHDRVLIAAQGEQERKTGSGILIPATVRMGRSLAWGTVAAIGPNVRSVKVGDRVLYDPGEAPEVEVRADTYVLVRERDLSAVATNRLEPDDEHTGLYL
ncbi:MAG: co-chaperone GroES [Propionibacteriaceae bacterium]|jgi:chaperonin GroES|nr:co-chaperone GroES [Propionibacteriaceae bacterium]